MLENTQFKELKLNVNKTNMVKLCKFYFPEILNKKLSDFFFFKYQRDSFYVLNVVVMNFIYLLIVAKFF